MLEFKPWGLESINCSVLVSGIHLGEAGVHELQYFLPLYTRVF